MRPFTTLDTFITPEGRKLTLHQREESFFIYLDGEELISSLAPGSEEALAELGCRDLPKGLAPRVLVGGLGFGYTLRAALAVLPRRAQVEVAEVFPAVVAWNRERLPRLFRDTLRDLRVKVREEDVRAVVAASEGRYDAILLDVDNGPEAWSLKANGTLYSAEGLGQLHAALAPGGRLAIWSAFPFPPFVQRLRKAGFIEATAQLARARGDKGARHTVFLGKKSGRPERT